MLQKHVCAHRPCIVLFTMKSCDVVVINWRICIINVLNLSLIVVVSEVSSTYIRAQIGILFESKSADWCYKSTCVHIVNKCCFIIMKSCDVVVINWMTCIINVLNLAPQSLTVMYVVRISRLKLAFCLKSPNLCQKNTCVHIIHKCCFIYYYSCAVVINWRTYSTNVLNLAPIVVVSEMQYAYPCSDWHFV